MYFIFQYSQFGRKLFNLVICCNLVKTLGAGHAQGRSKRSLPLTKQAIWYELKRFTNYGFSNKSTTKIDLYWFENGLILCRLTCQWIMWAETGFSQAQALLFLPLHWYFKIFCKKSGKFWFRRIFVDTFLCCVLFSPNVPSPRQDMGNNPH